MIHLLLILSEGVIGVKEYSLKKNLTVAASAAIITALVPFSASVAASGVSDNLNAKNADIKYEYGVFLGAEPEDIPDMESFRKIVVDAQSFTEEEISRLKESGHIVYSYINIGSVEEYRSYFDKFNKYTLGVYENWEDERWVDVSREEWQDFILDKLAKDILAKGVDGLFVDNCDVYYNFKEDRIYDGVTKILKGFKNSGTYVIINGGDTYVREYASRNNSIGEIMDAVNQESVFSAINWKEHSFTENKSSEREYFQNYCKLVSGYGKDVYLLEYTKNDKLIGEINKYCTENGYTYYASGTLDLTAPAQEKGAQPLRAVQLLAGDANSDNTVDLSDAVLIMQALANPNKYGMNGTDEAHITPQGAANADVEGGNGLTSNDALTIQRFLLNIIEFLPV